MRTLLCLSFLLSFVNTEYQVGVGIADITGPPAEVGMMGYAKLGQSTSGIHMRLYSRAFIFVKDNQRTVFVSTDTGMMDQLIKKMVIQELQAKFGNLYSFENVILSGTHTHSGPGGYIQYLMFDISSLGFIHQTFEAIVSGITQSIVSAHNNIVGANVYFHQGELNNASINRSPSSYDANPEEEKAKYKSNTDHIFSQVIILDNTGVEEELMGIINWFAVHPVSMQNSNHLISGDNKGYASYIFEKQVNYKAVPGKRKVVVAFASTNLGDVSPNLNGPRCLDTGEPCDNIHSTCNGKSQNCVADGPGKDMFESTQIIGQRQFIKALELYQDRQNWIQVTGPIRFAHQWINMTNYEVQLGDKVVKTCPSALGYSFAAGTTDGPGEFDFVQGTTSSNPFWDIISGFLKEPSEEQKACHYPKPILLDVGEMTQPYMWHPHIVDTQIVQIGNLLIGALPGEFTTMSGRRMRETIKSVAVKNGASEDIKVLLSGLSNVYTHYVTTFEEYEKQRYEGASTIYGPYTLDAYLQIYSILTESILQGKEIESGIPPPNLFESQISLHVPVLFDSPGLGHHFGDCLSQPKSMYFAPGDVVKATFVAGHPNNDMMLERTYLKVNRLTENFVETIAEDKDWETKFEWKRTFGGLGTSTVEITWIIPQNTPSGSYQIEHFGHFKSLLNGGAIYSYSGKSNIFEVTE